MSYRLDTDLCRLRDGSRSRRHAFLSRRGTEGSNPVPSIEESANHRFRRNRSRIHHKAGVAKPSRIGRMSIGSEARYSSHSSISVTPGRCAVQRSVPGTAGFDRLLPVLGADLQLRSSRRRDPGLETSEDLVNVE